MNKYSSSILVILLLSLTNLNAQDDVIKDDIISAIKNQIKFKIIERDSNGPVSAMFKFILKKNSNTNEKEFGIINIKSNNDGWLNLEIRDEIKVIIAKTDDPGFKSFTKVYNVSDMKLLDYTTIKIKKENGNDEIKEDNFFDGDFIYQNFRPIYFGYNSSKIKLRYIPGLYDIVNYLRKSKSRRLRIIGHSDYTGEYYKNVKISLRRAKAVRNYFLTFGLNKNRFIIKGFGSKYPTAYKFNELNRRVEFEIIK